MWSFLGLPMTPHQLNQKNPYAKCTHSIALIIFSMKAISSSDKPYLAYN
ncbi:MAG: hypothetical protein MR802_04995 [Prevotella sp.]|nr:hypothetical protein [Prevotella sp.]